MLALALSLLTLTPTAEAGGVGLLTAGGFRTQTVYFYDADNDLRKYSIGENIGNIANGLEVLLGDKDDKIIGHFRGFWMMETPEYDPANITSLVDPDAVVAQWRDEPRHVGMLTVGLQFGVYGQPKNFQIVANADIGSGFLTFNHTEFLHMEAGGGITKGFPGASGVVRDMQFWTSAVYVIRIDRGLQHGAQAYAGLRYMFD